VGDKVGSKLDTLGLLDGSSDGDEVGSELDMLGRKDGLSLVLGGDDCVGSNESLGVGFGDRLGTVEGRGVGCAAAAVSGS
jgi:hypothetical protein